MGIISNNEKLITEPRYFEGQVMESLLTDIHSIAADPLQRRPGLLLRGDRRPSRSAAGEGDRKGLHGHRGLHPVREGVLGQPLLPLREPGPLLQISSWSPWSGTTTSTASTPAPCSAPAGTPFSWWSAEPGPARPSSCSKAWRTTGRIFSTEMTHFRFTEKGLRVLHGLAL